MSQQRFTVLFREALWETHQKKCFWCGTGLLFQAVKVDHVLPERLASKKAERIKLLKRLRINITFKIRGNENLVPSCEDCNDKKHHHLLHDGALCIYLAKVKKSLLKLEENIKQKKADVKLDKVMRLIARGIDKGNFSIEEVKQGVEGVRLKAKLGGTKVTSSSAFNNGPPQETKSKRELNRLIWTSAALQQAKIMNLDSEHLYLKIMTALNRGNIEIHKLISPSREDAYALRVTGNLRLVFRREGKKMIITAISIHH